MTHTLVLPNGNQAAVLTVPQSAGGEEIQTALKLEHPHGVLILNGGTEEAPPSSKDDSAPCSATVSHGQPPNSK